MPKVDPKWLDLTKSYQFTSNIEVPTPMSGPQAVPKSYVDAVIQNVSVFLEEQLPYIDTANKVVQLTYPIGTNGFTHVEVEPIGGTDQTYGSDYTVRYFGTTAFICLDPTSTCPFGSFTGGDTNNPTVGMIGTLALGDKIEVGYTTAGLGGAAPGPQGFLGPQGATGAGVQGPQGDVGSTGTQGFTGNTGAVGPQGFTGIDGAQGLTGAGVQGAQGSLGSQGNTGLQGIDGSQGVTGSGFQGAVGAQGVFGAQGVMGSGFQGTTGSNGAQGVTGTGFQGSTGATGTQGATGGGVQGVAGPQGIQGLSGVLVSQSVLQATNGANQAANASFTDINFNTNSVLDGPDISHDISTNNDNFQINTTGSYLISYQLFGSADLGTNAVAQVLTNDTAVIAQSIFDDTNGNQTGFPSRSFIADLNSGDFITLQAKCTTAGNWLANLTYLSIVRIGGIVGAQGPAGGPQGFTGSVGPTGPQGFTGAGVQGATGATGSTGSTGVQGFTGATGAGFQGVQGPDGIQGIVGPQGFTGAGVQGATGSGGAPTQEAHTANFTLTGASNGNVVTNTGATGSVQGTLPAASPTLLYDFYCTENFTYTIIAAGTDTIQYGTFTGDTTLSLSLNTWVRMYCLKAGQWNIFNITGSYSLS